MESCFQLKGSLFTLSVLQLHSTDLEQLDKQLKSKVKTGPKILSPCPGGHRFKKCQTKDRRF